MAREGSHAVIVGGGVGGLALGLRLRHDGHRVTILERRATLGGKLGSYRRDGFTFDTGPSLITLPQLIDDVFAIAGSALADELTMVRLDPAFRYSWPDGSTWLVPDGTVHVGSSRNDSVSAAPDRHALDRFLGDGDRMWEVSERTFLAGPMSDPLTLARRMRSPRDLTTIRPWQTLDRFARARFDDARIVQWAGRYATYSGSSPRQAPAALACIPAIEARYGCWYPMGGVGELAAALSRLAARRGVALRTSAEVASIDRRGDRVVGVTLVDGSVVAGDLVVANADAEHVFGELAPNRRALRRVRRAPRSTSGLVIVAGVRGPTPGLAHHNVWFPPDGEREFDQLNRGEPADDPTIYACVSSLTDPAQAPPGHENWFLLVNTPPIPEAVPAAYAQVVLDRLASTHGLDLRPRLVFHEVVTPGDLAERFRSPGGAIYGTSSNGRRAAFLRPANRGPGRGLYLVGGSSHPGGGLPLVLTSARIVAELIAQDGW